MLVRRGLFRLLAHARGQKTSGRRGIQNGVQEAGPRAFEMTEHRVLYGVADMALLRDGIDQPKRFCPARIDGLAGQHQTHRLHRIYQTREARGAAEAGM